MKLLKLISTVAVLTAISTSVSAQQVVFKVKCSEMFSPEIVVTAFDDDTINLQYGNKEPFKEPFTATSKRTDSGYMQNISEFEYNK